MPELPEIENICQSIVSYIIDQEITKVVIYQSQLRWPIEVKLTTILLGQIIIAVQRRAKYILITCTTGTLIIHLGMTGKLRILNKGKATLIGKHDHLDIIFNNNLILRYTDPRRFGSIHWAEGFPLQHKLLANLGIEPLTKKFSGEYLVAKASNRCIAIKKFLMDHTIVVGIGNIYANEVLFRAGIYPTRMVSKITLTEYKLLVKSIKIILQQAIKKGGTTINGEATINNFLDITGMPGGFAPKLKVYGRSGKPCYNCKTKLQEIKLNQRTTVFCPNCQH